jgi:hypothetical protein
VIASWPPNRFHSKPLFSNDIKVNIFSGAARIEALTVSGQAMWRKAWSHPRSVGLFKSVPEWQTNCNISRVHHDEVLMFKITQNTINGFTLAEILLMAAMNEIEAKRKASATGSIPKGLSRSWR